MVSVVAVPHSPLWDAFLAVSARIGGDIGLIQGAGGNTSLKDDGVLWIKASGRWLVEVEARPIMVPVDLAALRARVLRAIWPKPMLPAWCCRVGLRGCARRSRRRFTPCCRGVA